MEGGSTNFYTHVHVHHVHKDSYMYMYIIQQYNTCMYLDDFTLLEMSCLPLERC